MPQYYPDFISLYRAVSGTAEENKEIEEVKEVPADVQETITKKTRKKKAE